MKFFFKLLRLSIIGLFSAFTLGVVLLAGVYIYLAPSLPSTEILKDVQLQTPLRVLSRDGALIAEFGEKKRSPLKYADTPDLLIKAVLAAEDNRFYEHPGVDYQGILRAVVHLAKTGRKGQGGSTITMQVARNFFLSREKTYLRKISEIFLALKIEREISKQEILELYLNKIYLGHRSYGVSAAAQVYYGKNINDLRVDQLAMIAGLPKAPSTNNPIRNKRKAMTRRNYVLGRMFDLAYIDKAAYEQAIATIDDASLHGLSIELEAPYVAEMVRAEMVKKFEQDAYTQGYRVYTTIDTRLQRYANRALRRAMTDYEYRHGYRGVESNMKLEPALIKTLPAIEPPSLNRPESESESEPLAAVVIENLAEDLVHPVKQRLREIPVVGGLLPAVVFHVEEKAITVLLRNGELLRIDWSGLKWARKYIDENTRGPIPKFAADIVKQGNIVRVHKTDDGKVKLSQIPSAKGAMVSLDPNDASIKALVGGYDFYYSKFNRVTQARRQPGSNFKPFIYSAALESGFTAASMVNDAPVVFDDSGLENTWRPENYSGKFFGPTRLRVGLMKSRNLISIRLLRAIGIKKAINYSSKFGFEASRLPKDLSLALGSASMTPLELVGGYAAIANGGYRVMPYFINRIEDDEGNIIFQSNPDQVCRECEKQQELALQKNLQKEIAADDENIISEEIIDDETKNLTEINIAERIMTEQNNYILSSILSDVIRSGTGRRALRMGRKDLAGKTGTTNDQKDAWFSGFSSTLVTTVWVGFDNNGPLGSRETGASAALPMWIYFMENAMKGVPEKVKQVPPGIVTVKIDPETGLLAAQGQTNSIFEIFRTDNIPKQTARTSSIGEKNQSESVEQAPEQIF